MKARLSTRVFVSLTLAVLAILTFPMAPPADAGVYFVDAGNGVEEAGGIPVADAPDATAPVTEAALTPSPNAAGWNRGNVAVVLSARDEEGGSGVKQITYSTTGAYTTSGTVAGASASLAVTVEGTTTVTFYAEDVAGNVEAPKELTVNIDKSYPTIWGSPARRPNANGWYNDDVSIHWSVYDAVSGIDPATVPSDTVVAGEGDWLVAGPVSVSDKAGHTTSGYVSGLKIDKTPPTVSLLAPVEGATYLVNETVKADYAAEDELSGVAACEGTVPNGGAIDTSTAGPKSFTVTATDLAGNATSETVSYTIVYGVNLLEGNRQSFKSGSTVQISLQLLDANGANLSSPDVAVHAMDVSAVAATAEGSLGQPGAKSSDDSFSYRSNIGGTGGYLYRLSTKGFGTGTYELHFVVGDDSGTVYSVGFQLR